MDGLFTWEVGVHTGVNSARDSEIDGSVSRLPFPVRGSRHIHLGSSQSVCFRDINSA